MYPWPLGEFDNVMDVALEIAMDYLDRTGRSTIWRPIPPNASGLFRQVPRARGSVSV